MILWTLGKRKKSRAISNELGVCSVVVVFLLAWNCQISAHPVPLLFKHPQNLMIIFEKITLFEVQLSCNLLNSQLMIPTCHLTYLMLASVLLVEGLPTRGVIFFLLMTLFDVIPIYLLKHFKCLRPSFQQLDQKFQVYSSTIHSSVFIAEQPKKD